MKYKNQNDVIQERKKSGCRRLSNISGWDFCPGNTILNGVKVETT